MKTEEDWKCVSILDASMEGKEIELLNSEGDIIKVLFETIYEETYDDCYCYLGYYDKYYDPHDVLTYDKWREL